MGYRSDWKIVFNTLGKAQQVRDTLNQYVASHTTDASVLLEEMLASAVEEFNDDVLILGESCWKLGAWDDLVGVLPGLFANDPEIDLGWIRLGEDQDDNEARSGDFTHLYIQRSIDLDYGPPLPVSKPEVAVQVKAVCQCDLNQLMRGDGHDANCPERP